jgi:hypothetical protein
MRSMKYLLLAVSLLLAACTQTHAPGALNQLSPGVIEDVQPVELGDPAPPEDEPDDDAEPTYGDRLVVRLDDGRTVYLVYTGPRHFEAGEAVRVHLSDAGVFVL